jgi:acetyl esterase/lipase
MIVIAWTGRSHGGVPEVETVPLWTGSAPIVEGAFETIEGKPFSASVWRPDMPIGDGTPETVFPQITLFRPATERATGTAIVICPGGGYMRLVRSREGPVVAQWLADHGIVGVVLEYRMPRGRPTVPLLDAQRALRTVRTRSREWKLEPNRIGIMGFSAGGHLAAVAGTHFDAGDPEASDPIDRNSSRPDFMVLIYPVITMGEKTHSLTKKNLLGVNPVAGLVNLYSNEKQVIQNTPPTFLAHAVDDTAVPPENSRLFFTALKEVGVAAEYLELPYGGHGLNGCQGPMWEAWKERSLAWLLARGIIPSAMQTPSHPGEGTSR